MDALARFDIEDFLVPDQCLHGTKMEFVVAGAPAHSLLPGQDGLLGLSDADRQQILNRYAYAVPLADATVHHKRSVPMV
jgi:hypothetical protein